MNTTPSKTTFWPRLAGALAAAGLLALSGTAWATEQAKQRQEGRDVKQEGKQEARKAKVDCKAADQKNNAECRQDNRDGKQDARQDKREVKH
jgi:hypothetical protein